MMLSIIIILSFTLHLQRRNYQISKEIVHELKFGDIAVMQIQTICNIATGFFLTLIGRLECLKEAKTMDIILGKCKCPNSCPYFQ